MMNMFSPIRFQVPVLSVIGVALLFASGQVVAGTAMSTVHTWPARPGRALSSDDVLKVTEMGGVSIQSGGRLVSFTTLSADPVCNCYHVKLNILDQRTREVSVLSDLGQPFLIQYPDGSNSGWPCVAESLWSNDGRYLAYIVNRGGHGLLFVYDSRAAQSRRLALGGDEVFAFTWARSSERIIYQTGGPRPASVRRLQRGEKEGYLFGSEFASNPAGMPLIARVPESRIYKEEASIFASDRAWSDLRAVDVVTGGKMEATAGERALASSSELSYSQQPMQDATEVESGDGQFAVRLDDTDPDHRGRAVTIIRNGASAIHKSSADVCPAGVSARRVALVFWDSGTHRFVLICSISGFLRAGGPGEIVSLDPVSGSSQTLFGVDATNPEGEFGRQCDAAAGKVICVREGPSQPPALFALNIAEHAAVQLYDPNEGLRRKGYSRIDRLVWNNSEGLSTQADLVYPYAYVSDTRYPLVITQYSDGGFLRGNTGDENPIFAYAESGFFVLSFRQTAPGPREARAIVCRANRREWQGGKWRKSIQDSLDIVIQNLIDRGLVDPFRVAYTGLSGGANQIDYALANGKRIAAVITSTCCWVLDSWSNNPLNPDFYNSRSRESRNRQRPVQVVRDFS